MDNKLTGILLGILLILSGVLFYFRNIFYINISTFIIFLIGIVFIILYIEQNKKWALILGIYFIYFSSIGILNTLTIFNNNIIIDKFFYSLGGFFCCPGLIFDIIYIREKKASQLTAGLSLTVIGISIILGIHFFEGVLIGLGTSLIVDSYTQRNKNTTQTIIGIFIIIFGLRNIIHIWNLDDILITIILICLGGILIVKTILKEKK